MKAAHQRRRTAAYCGEHCEAAHPTAQSTPLSYSQTNRQVPDPPDSVLNMSYGTSYKALANETKYPYIVELVVADDKLDVELGRRIMNFHRSHKIQVRHGRTIVREGQSY